MWGDISIAFLLAFVTAFVVTPYTIRLANKVGAIDKPEKRRINEKPMPRLGRNSCNYRILSFKYIFTNHNDTRENIQSIWRRRIFL